MDDKKVQFIPFHALNEFMLVQYRLHVIQFVLSKLDQVSPNQGSQINRQIRKYVSVPGFRNSSLAPVPVKANRSVTLFEKNPDFVSAILSAWCELKPELAEKMVEFLKNRGWEILPLDANRSKLPGFLTEWPPAESFDRLIKEFRESYPAFETTDDDLSLMAVWISGRLPYNQSESDSENPA